MTGFFVKKNATSSDRVIELTRKRSRKNLFLPRKLLASENIRLVPDSCLEMMKRQVQSEFR